MSLAEIIGWQEANDMTNSDLNFLFTELEKRNSTSE